MILNRVNQNVQETLKKFQDNKNRVFEKAQEKINEPIEALYKHQSETKNTNNKEINELRMKIDNLFSSCWSPSPIGLSCFKVSTLVSLH
jgi:polyhydroxyalkanoate synthesis regulator phasin